jgi:hypothetical protein
VTSIKCILTISIFLSAAMIAAPDSYCQEEAHYRNIKMENCSCHVGVLYKKTSQATTIAVSAVAAGKGSEFRKWDITAIRLVCGGERIRPDKEEKFFVRKENFFRVPSAVLFAVIGGAAGANIGGSGLQQGINSAGLAVGLGLLTLAAKGEITGQKDFFTLNEKTADGVTSGRDFIKITAEDQDMHLKEDFKIGVIKPLYALNAAFAGYKKMSDVELGRALDGMKDRIAALEGEQSSYRSGGDPEYDRIQKEIEDLESERGIVYRIWLEKGVRPGSGE